MIIESASPPQARYIGALNGQIRDWNIRNCQTATPMPPTLRAVDGSQTSVTDNAELPRAMYKVLSCSRRCSVQLETRKAIMLKCSENSRDTCGTRRLGETRDFLSRSTNGASRGAWLAGTSKSPEDMQSTRHQTTSGSSEPHAPQYKTEEATRNNDAPGPEEEQQKLEPTPSSQAAARKNEHLEDIRSSHEDLSELTEENLTEYTGLLVAHLRAAESKRDDALINDPYAETLAGEAGAALLSFFSKWSPSASQLSDYIAFRTRNIDEALLHRHDDIHQVVILGSGLDSRAYRMKALSDCHVIEVDSNQSLVERKQKLLHDAGAQVLAKQHHVVVADLAQDMWQTGLISKGFNPKEPTFWVLEGLLYYMNQDSNVRLVKTIDALSAPHSQLWADISGFALVKGGGSGESEGLFRTRALKYGENNPKEGVLAMLKWQMEVTALDGTGPTELYGRELHPMKWHSTVSGEDEVVPWFFVTATKPQATSEAPLL